MKELSEYTDELHRRVELRIETRRQRRRRTLAVCVPLALVLVIGVALVLPRLAERFGTTDAVPGPDGVISAGANPAGPGSPVAAGQNAQTDANGEMDGAAPPGGLSPADGLSEGAEIPADFSFRLVWGCYGISSYDSATGELVKTGDATRPEDYVTTHTLTEAERDEAWTLLSGLDLGSYPGSYDPYNDPASAQRVATEPSRDLILTLRAGGTETTVSCRGICLGGAAQGYDEKARAFLDACDRLSGLLQSTPEWQALPDYEFYYE